MFGEYVKAKEYLGKALVISKEIVNRDGEASFWANLGVVPQLAGEKAIEYHEKALAINKGICGKIWKSYLMKTFERCFNHLVTMKRLKNITRN